MSTCSRDARARGDAGRGAAAEIITLGARCRRGHDSSSFGVRPRPTTPCRRADVLTGDGPCTCPPQRALRPFPRLSQSYGTLGYALAFTAQLAAVKRTLPRARPFRQRGRLLRRVARHFADGRARFSRGTAFARRAVPNARPLCETAPYTSDYSFEAHLLQVDPRARRGLPAPRDTSGGGTRFGAEERRRQHRCCSACGAKTAQPIIISAHARNSRVGASRPGTARGVHSESGDPGRDMPRVAPPSFSLPALRHRHPPTGSARSGLRRCAFSAVPLRAGTCHHFGFGTRADRRRPAGFTRKSSARSPNSAA